MERVGGSASGCGPRFAADRFISCDRLDPFGSPHGNLDRALLASGWFGQWLPSARQGDVRQAEGYN